MPDCHVCLEDDRYLSRHHFIIEISPPRVRLQDLGSLNGTYVNGVKLVGRTIPETSHAIPNQYAIPYIDLHHGDVIKTGDTAFNILIQSPEPAQKVVKCQKCGRDASKEIGAGVEGAYFCDICRKKLKSSPFELLQHFLEEPKPFQKSLYLSKTGFQEDIPFEMADYDVVKVLGGGVFGASYLIKNRDTAKDAALKLMLPETAVSSTGLDSFLKDASVVCGLKHNNITRVQESGYRNGIFYFLMDYGNLGNMDAMRRKGKIPLNETILSSLQVLEALTHAHSEEFVHHAIKPQNILLHQSNGNLIAKLSDFGLDNLFSLSGFAGMTLTGETKVSFQFLPVEKIVDYQNSKPGSDIWSLGATLYHMLTGEFPRSFSPDKDPLEIILSTPIVPIRSRDPSIPREIADVIDHAIQNDPADRYQHAGEMLSALRRVWKKKL
jgi:serine/threonine protein kinase